MSSIGETRTLRRWAPACSGWSTPRRLQSLHSGVSVGCGAGALARAEHGAGPTPAGGARAEARARGPDRLHERPHRDAIGAGSGVWRGSPRSRDHTLSPRTGLERSSTVPRRPGGDGARPSEVGSRLFEPIHDALRRLYQSPVPQHSESGRTPSLGYASLGLGAVILSEAKDLSGHLRDPSVV